MDIRRIGALKQGEQNVGNRTRVKVVKNKVAPPYRQAAFDMIHGYGISKEGCLVDMGVESGLVEKSGSWMLYKGERLGQGRENAKEYLRDNAQVAGEIETSLREKYLVLPGAKPAGQAPVEPQEAAVPEEKADEARADAGTAKGKTAPKR